MSDIEAKKEEQLVDILGLKRYYGKFDAGYECLIEHPGGNLFRVSDVEAFLKKLCTPGNLTKITGALIMGKPLKLEDLIS